MSPASKLAKRGSWGTGCQGAAAGSPPSSSLLLPNDESHDGYPNRELLASTADCLRIWECARNADVGAAGGRNFDGVTGTLEDEESSVGTGSGASGYAGWRGKDASTNIRTRFNLWEKSVLAHVSDALTYRNPLSRAQQSHLCPTKIGLTSRQSKSSMSPPAPLTSFSWNQPSPNLIVTSSIDTTCTIWDLPTRTALTQLIAHDREVYDVDWCPGSSDVFASVGADGSVRVFDLRSLEHSTIIYETAGPPPSSSRPGTGMSTSSSSRNGSTAGVLSGPAAPLLRIAFNPWDANYLATFHMESDSIQILDVRAPGLPILELKGHKSGINAVAWGPPSQTGASLNTISGAGSGSSSSSISKGMLCTAADDAHVLVYDLASSTLRSASAQGRRSRTSNAAAAAAAAGAGAAGVGGAAPSPAPSHHRHQSLSHSLSSASLSSAGWGSATPVEYPFMAYEAKEMVNNVAWFRPASHRDGAGASMEIGRVHGRSPSTSMLEWNEYTATARGGGAGSSGPVRQDWLACVAGRDLRALRVG